MEGFSEEGKSVGLILDLSLRLSQDKRRIIDGVKTAMVEVLRSNFEHDVDSFYLYHPEIVEAVTQLGEQVCAVGNYETDGWRFDLDYAFKQTLYVLEAVGEHDRKYLIYITDRFQNSVPVEKAFFINRKDRIDCHFVMIGVGALYNMNVLNELSEKYNGSFYHIDHPSELKQIFGGK